MKRLITTNEANKKYPDFVRSMSHVRVLVEHLQNTAITDYRTLLSLLQGGLNLDFAPQGHRYWRLVRDRIVDISHNVGMFRGIDPIVFRFTDPRSLEFLDWREAILEMFLIEEYDFKQFEKDDDDDF